MSEAAVHTFRRRPFRVEVAQLTEKNLPHLTGWVTAAGHTAQVRRDHTGALVDVVIDGRTVAGADQILLRYPDGRFGQLTVAEFNNNYQPAAAASAVPGLYQHRTVDVEAIRLSEEDLGALTGWAERNGHTPHVRRDGQRRLVCVLVGELEARLGDWVLRYPDGRFDLAGPDDIATAFTPLTAG